MVISISIGWRYVFGYVYMYIYTCIYYVVIYYIYTYLCTDMFSLLCMWKWHVFSTKRSRQVVWSEAAPLGTILAGGLLVPWRRKRRCDRCDRSLVTEDPMEI